jgi:predicted amidohydrolase
MGTDRRVFTVGPLTFGIVICHEGWRYPETMRWAVRRGAQVVFHPHAHVPEPGSYRPATFADPANTFHEKAMLCRATENTCYFASVNCASDGSGTTSALVRRDATLQCYQPTARRAYSSRIWISAPLPDCSRPGAGSHRYSDAAQTALHPTSFGAAASKQPRAPMPRATGTRLRHARNSRTGHRC